MRRIALVTAAVAALAIAAPARATVTVINYTLSGDGTGSLAMNFDSNTSHYSLGTLDLIIGTAVFSEANSVLSPFSTNPLAIGGTQGGAEVLVGGTNDFEFVFIPTASTQTVQLFTIFANSNEIPPTGSLTITQSGPRTPAVPEPASWAMMLLGFGGVGVALRRRKRAPALA
jgi:hypothetical protein